MVNLPRSPRPPLRATIRARAVLLLVALMPLVVAACNKSGGSGY